MDPELRASRISVSLHTLVGILAGWLSIYLGGALLALLVAIGLLILTGYFCELIVGKRGMKWWLSNGIVIYLFIWLISWVFLFNFL